MASLSLEYSPMMKEGAMKERRKNTMDTRRADKEVSLKLRYSPSLSFLPTYWLSIMDAAVTTAFTTVEHSPENFPAKPMAAMETLPSCPTIIWAAMLKEDCRRHCSVTGRAMENRS